MKLVCHILHYFWLRKNFKGQYKGVTLIPFIVGCYLYQLNVDKNLIFLKIIKIILFAIKLIWYKKISGFLLTSSVFAYILASFFYPRALVQLHAYRQLK